jgi:hypothetical protein
MFSIFRKTNVCLGLFSFFAFPCVASAFSLGIRAGGGMEMNTVSAWRLFTVEGEPLNKGGETSRNFISFGADLVVTPVTFGSMSVSALLGARLTSSKATGDFNDELSLMYLPIGASFDYLLGRLRMSGYATFDLGLSAKLKISVPATGDSLEPKLASLSRIRFGALGEFFIIPALSVYGQADYGMGGYKNDTGGKEFRVNLPSSPDTPAQLATNDNKLKGLTFGGGVAYYFPPPKSGSVSSGSKAVPGKKPAKGTGKRPPAKPRPKPKAPPAGTGL